MTTAQAVKVAIESLHREMKQINAQANLYDRHHLDTPGTVNASKRRAKLFAAIEILEGMKQP